MDQARVTGVGQRAEERKFAGWTQLKLVREAMVSVSACARALQIGVTDLFEQPYLHKPG